MLEKPAPWNESGVSEWIAECVSMVTFRRRDTVGVVGVEVVEVLVENHKFSVGKKRR